MDYLKEWAAKNHKKVLGYKRKYDNKPSTRKLKNEWARKDYAKHPKKDIEAIEEWRNKNRPHVRELTTVNFHNRRAEPKLTIAELEKIRAEEPFCRICRKPSEHIDHIIPVAKGGTNERSNLQMLCSVCHGKKTYSGL